MLQTFDESASFMGPPAAMADPKLPPFDKPKLPPSRLCHDAKQKCIRHCDGRDRLRRGHDPGGATLAPRAIVRSRRGRAVRFDGARSPS
jgi:hypothetical protein